MLLYLIFYTFIFYSNIMPCLEISITFTVNILYHDLIKKNIFDKMLQLHGKNSLHDNTVRCTT